MKKTLSIVILLLVAVAGAAAANATVLKVRVQTANVRSEPDTSASVIAQLKLGTLIEASSKVDSWYEITVTNKSGESVVGYIHTSVVEVVGGQTAPPQEPRPVRKEPEPAVAKPAPTYYRAAAPSAVKRLKILAGVAFANQRLDSESQNAIDDYDLKKGNLLGITAGIGYEFSLSNNLCLELNGFYVPGGMKVTGEYQGAKIEVKAHGAAVGLGLLGKYKFMTGGSTPYAMAGVDLGYVLSMKTKTTTGSNEGKDEDALDDVNRMYYGIDLGLGYEHQLGGLTLVIEGRYMLGLSNMAKKPADVEDKDWDTYTKPTTMAIMIGIKL